MMKTYLFSVALLSACVLTACASKRPADDGTVSATVGGKDSKVLKERTYDLRDFNRISAGGILHIHFTQGKTYKVVVRAPQEYLDDCLLHVENGTLTIGWKSSHTFNSNVTPHLYVTAPDLHSVKLNGATKFEASDITTDNMDIETSGASLFSVGRLQCKQHVTATCSGATKLNVQDMQCDRFSSTFSGAVKFTTSLKAQSAELSSSGAVKQNIHVEADELIMKNSGAVNGNLTFNGKTLDLNESGATKTHAKVECSRLKAIARGAVNTEIEGTADDTDIQISGAAKISTARLNKF